MLRSSRRLQDYIIMHQRLPARTLRASPLHAAPHFLRTELVIQTVRRVISLWTTWQQIIRIESVLRLGM